ncbi:CopG family ribbon-helix-helix protein [Cerasicoccus frondis]|uniref:CopG family ribbon-helix-helix protein n=1 Tax=Cerasicoccus frondis TaxID=490090 RepID=UPI0028527044|nr:ribbon-helix-helix protein, CopG family [Cerasicoccus frondis]
MPRKTTKSTKTKGKTVTKRAPGKTQISISLPADLIDRIDKLAALENRNRSNFIATALDRVTE